METVKEHKEDPLVSITCITYNHEMFISQTLESFLMQKTNFPFEILVGEDCSTDNTRSIIQEYCKKYPDILTLVTSEKNVGARKNGIRIRERAKGKYIAMCEGDDFWTDPFKLQKQVDFLESSPDYVMCCHYSKVIDENGETIYLDPNPVPLEYSYEDILVGKRKETRTATILVRNGEHIRNLGNMEWFMKSHGGDVFFRLFATQVSKGKIFVIPEVMSCYRHHPGGIWSRIDPKVKKKKARHDFSLLVENFKYSSAIKKQILKRYLDNFLLYDLKALNIKSIVTTVKYLL